MAVAFTLPAGTSSPRVFEVEGKLALLQVLEHVQPDEKEIERAIDAEREQLLEQKRRTLADAWLAERRDKLAAEGTLNVNLDPLGRS
jgi:parvulin-like peptidyl-prolyl isomerase